MTLYLVRHAKAGKRSEWHDDDLLRPLSNTGWKQTEMLAEKFAKLRVTNLISSPATRCIQTLEPLAKIKNLKIKTDRRLIELGDLKEMLEIAEEVEDSSVLASHGDMIPELIKTLQRRGMNIETKPDWRKGSVWVVERTNKGFESASAWPPPQIDED
ncbi:MAG: SixA phosphatase family protein [Actinomycetota bacterium]